jgi:hypothetical protein
MSTSTTGTGTITLGSAVSGFQTFADAGITNGQTVRYAIDDGANFEIGSGTYTSSGTTLTRSVTESSNSDSAISLSGSAEVFIAATVADLNPLYAANESSPAAQPSATGANAIAIGDSAVASNQDSIAIGDGANSAAYFGVAIGWGASTTSNGSRGIAIGKSATTDGISSFAAGDSATITNTGTSAVALGTSHAAGTDSFAAVISTNSSSYGASGGNSVAIGPNAKCTGDGVAIGRAAQSTTNYAYSIGFGSIASGNYSFSAGRDTTASARATVALGEASLANIQGKMSFASSKFAANGDAQGGQFILRSDTTDATAEAMTTSNSAASATNQIVAASDTCITFHGTVVAMQNGAQAHAGWEIKGMLVNDGGTTTLALGNVSDMAATNASNWVVALSADNTNNALKIQVTGEASHNIRWVANVQTSEVTYA